MPRMTQEVLRDRADYADLLARLATGLTFRVMPIDILAQIGFLVFAGIDGGKTHRVGASVAGPRPR
jgi:hypothetical protein